VCRDGIERKLHHAESGQAIETSVAKCGAGFLALNIVTYFISD